jgi:tetratricopeptide (TPR) repeat protein
MQLFISHSSGNQSFCREIRNKIRRSFPAKVTVWLDEDFMKSGMVLDVEIKKAIDEHSDFFIIFIVEKLLTSDWVQKELKWALEKQDKIDHPFIIPVLLNSASESICEKLWGKVGYKYKTLFCPKCSDKADDETDAFVKKLKEDIFCLVINRMEEAKTKEKIVPETKELKKELKKKRKEEPDKKWDFTEKGLDLLEKLKFEEAIKEFNKAIKENPYDTIAMNGLGLVYLDTAKYEEAINHFEKALSIDLPAHGEKHGYVATRNNNIGLAWDSLGDYNKALEYYDKALKINLKVYGDTHPNVATNYNNIGLAWYSLGEYKKALDYYNKAHGIFLKVLGGNHPNTQVVKNHIEGLKGKIR